MILLKPEFKCLAQVNQWRGAVGLQGENNIPIQVPGYITPPSLSLKSMAYFHTDGKEKNQDSNDLYKCCIMALDFIFSAGEDEEVKIDFWAAPVQKLKSDSVIILRCSWSRNSVSLITLKVIFCCENSKSVQYFEVSTG